MQLYSTTSFFQDQFGKKSLADVSHICGRTTFIQGQLEFFFIASTNNSFVENEKLNQTNGSNQINSGLNHIFIDSTMNRFATRF